ncbi:hypothetical protein BE11_15635 [Sorangium cellulosum]|nr:hypothetical protein BE11_15635 [Sorangium cellulosum]
MADQGLSGRNRRPTRDDIRGMLYHTPPHSSVYTVTHGLPLGLSLQLCLVDGKLSGALWLFCDRYRCEAGMGEA